MTSKKIRTALAAVAANIVVISLYIVPFLFVVLNSFKDKRAASQMKMSWPETFHPENYIEVTQTPGSDLFQAFQNSFIITIMAVVLTIFLCSTIAFYIQRRHGRGTRIINGLLMIGLMVPVAVMPTIWVLNALNLYRLKIGLVLVQVAVGIPFSMMLYRSYVATVPKEIDEAAIIDGCGTWRLFFSIIFPILKPVTATVIILTSINVFNDFANALYFLPGAKNATVQLTLYNFMGAYSNKWNLLFADIVIVCIPMVILFLFFNKQIVAGMTGGAVKG